MPRLNAGSSDLTPEEALGRFYPPSRRFWKNLRNQYRCSQAQMARRLGTTVDTYARWERGEASPHLLTYVGALALSRQWPSRPPVPLHQRKRRVAR